MQRRTIMSDPLIAAHADIIGITIPQIDRMISDAVPFPTEANKFASLNNPKLIAIAIVGGPDSADAGDLAKHDYCTPCGICRQVMRDFADPHKMRVICAKSVNDYKEWTLDEMLPESFGPEHLKV